MSTLMALKIMPHGRLQGWVAEENCFFTAEGLEYSFVLEGDYGVSLDEPGPLIGAVRRRPRCGVT